MDVSRRYVFVTGERNAPRNEAVQKTILIVEDEVLLRLIIADTLRQEGFRVFQANDADEAIKILQSSIPVHLVATDIRMPGSMDGLALLDRMRATWPGIKTMIISGNTSDIGTSRADAVIEKPFMVDEVVRRIQQLLAEPGEDA